MIESEGPFKEELVQDAKIKDSRTSAVNFLMHFSSDVDGIDKLVSLIKADPEELDAVIGHLDTFYSMPVSELADYGLGEDAFAACQDVVDRLDIALGFNNPPIS